MSDWNCKAEQCLSKNSDYEPPKKAVISAADARAHPNAVVVELRDTIVAVVAVGGAFRPKDHASLTVFDSLCWLPVIHKVKEPFVFEADAGVPGREIALALWPHIRAWYDAGVRSRRQEQEKCAQQLQEYTNYEKVRFITPNHRLWKS